MAVSGAPVGGLGRVAWGPEAGGALPCTGIAMRGSRKHLPFVSGAHKFFPHQLPRSQNCVGVRISAHVLL